jgi:hypothetical protein
MTPFDSMMESIFLKIYIENQSIDPHTMQPLPVFLTSIGVNYMPTERPVKFWLKVPASRSILGFAYQYTLGDDEGNRKRRAESQSEIRRVLSCLPSDGEEDKAHRIKEMVSEWYLSYEPTVAPVWVQGPVKLQVELSNEDPLGALLHLFYAEGAFCVSTFVEKQRIENANDAIHFYMVQLGRPMLKHSLMDVEEDTLHKLYNAAKTIYGMECAIPLLAEMPTAARNGLMKNFTGNAPAAIKFLNEVRLCYSNLAIELYHSLDDATAKDVLEVMIAAYKAAMQTPNSETE